MVVVFVGVLRLFCFGCGTTVETTVLPEVLLLLDNDDGITTRGSTLGTVTNDGRFEIWAVMGVANVRRRRGGNGLGVCAIAGTDPSPSGVVTADTRGELEAALVVTALVAACASIATAATVAVAVAVAVATSVVATFGCGLRRIIVVHKERRPR